jgi:hypothetical protein
LAAELASAPKQRPIQPLAGEGEDIVLLFETTSNLR